MSRALCCIECRPGTARCALWWPLRAQRGVDTVRRCMLWRWSNVAALRSAAWRRATAPSQSFSLTLFQLSSQFSCQSRTCRFSRVACSVKKHNNIIQSVPTIKSSANQTKFVLDRRTKVTLVPVSYILVPFSVKSEVKNH